MNCPPAVFASAPAPSDGGCKHRTEQPHARNCQVRRHRRWRHSGFAKVVEISSHANGRQNQDTRRNHETHGVRTRPLLHRAHTLRKNFHSRLPARSVRLRPRQLRQCDIATRAAAVLRVNVRAARRAGRVRWTGSGLRSLGPRFLDAGDQDGLALRATISSAGVVDADRFAACGIEKKIRRHVPVVARKDIKNHPGGRSRDRRAAGLHRSLA